MSSPLGVVELADGRRAEPVDDLADRVAERLLLGGEADVHQSSLPARSSEPASSSSRSVRRSTLPDGSRGIVVDDDDVAEVLVGGERVGDELLRARRRRPGASGSSCTAATGTSPARSSGNAEHRAVEHRGVAVQHRLDLGRRHLEAVDLDHLLRAVGEVDPALGLEPADVAGAVPAVGEGLGVASSGR